ncbi:MAG TPA: endonuclease domain-containing protein [Candidatus Dormibacteraeota bacterium]|nr:endonuclease domain-containing protein [Candidatus Dormibacteraeota bacterium]
MSKYRHFVFEDYVFDKSAKLLTLKYSLDNALSFVETYRFPFDFADYSEAMLDRACQALFFMAGVSYFKTYVPPEIIIKKGELDNESAAFFSKIYQRGLGEFWYVNNLDVGTPVTFPVTTETLSAVAGPTRNAGLLVAIGGGKDSLVAVEILRESEAVTTWSVNHRQMAQLVAKIGLPHLWVERVWDKQLLDLKNDAYNGHVPISAIYACAGTVVGVLTGRRDIVVSNEQSANEPTLLYQGIDVNHQYSKSQEFESDFQNYLAHIFGRDTVRYYSFLRPFSELRIAELFARLGFDKYKDVFSSCNRAFRLDSDRIFWCGECPKCAFVFLALTPFVERADLEKLWGGKNLLLDRALEPIYQQLLGIEGDKPLDCVGEVKESRAAMRLAQKIYPELDKYTFELPADYDFRVWSDHVMPDEILDILRSAVKTT